MMANHNWAAPKLADDAGVRVPKSWSYRQYRGQPSLRGNHQQMGQRATIEGIPNTLADNEWSIETRCERLERMEFIVGQASFFGSVR